MSKAEQRAIDVVKQFDRGWPVNPLGCNDVRRLLADLTALRTANEELRKELEAARADVARYRWLRHGDNDEKVLCNGPVAKDYWYLLRLGGLDAVIDAAIAQEAKP